MNSSVLFGMALGLQSPWEVREVSFAEQESGQKKLYLHIGFASGSRFPDETKAACSAYDRIKREWQHLNFFEHHCAYFLYGKLKFNYPPYLT